MQKFEETDSFHERRFQFSSAHSQCFYVEINGALATTTTTLNSIDDVQNLSGKTVIRSASRFSSTEFYLFFVCVILYLPLTFTFSLPHFPHHRNKREKLGLSSVRLPDQTYASIFWLFFVCKKSICGFL